MNHEHEHQHGHEAGGHCEHHGSNPPMCSCDHNPGGECHCPPNECKCDQQHHKHGETQHGHDCCSTDAKHDGPTQSTKTVINNCRHHPYEMCSCPDEHRAASVEALAAELATGGAAAHDMHGMDHSMHAVHDHSSHDHSGHDHSHHDPKIFARQFWFALVLTIPTMLYSPMFNHLTNLSLPAFPGSEWVAPILGVALFFTGGMVFLKTGWAEIKGKQPGMMALIALALVVSLGYSLAVTISTAFSLGFSGMDFWWELAALVSIMLLGHWIEMSSVMRAQNAVGELAKLIPDTAEVIRGGVNKRIPVAEIKLGDIVLVRAGASIPVDGVVTKGESKVNESMITGESAMVLKTVGSQVIAGTINGEIASVGRGGLELGEQGLESSATLGALNIKVTAIGGDTMLSGIMKLVSQAQQGKSRTQRLADRAAGWLFYAALGSAIITLVAWLVIGGTTPDFIIERVVTVLVIACPHALGLAIPLVTAITTAKAANSGVLIRDRIAFESLRNVDTVLFDKTGTLTTGERGVVGLHLSQVSDLASETDLLALAAGIEADSEHSLATAIRNEAKARKVKAIEVRDQMVVPGIGVSGRLDQHRVFAGGPALLSQNGINIGVNDLVAADAEQSRGATVVFIVRDDQLLGQIAVGDTVRESAATAVAELQAMGKRVVMLSGDAHAVAKAVAAELGIDEVFAEVLPHQKAEVVAKLQADKHTVAMVGDGVNDAPALAQANVGLAIGTGTDVAIESAGVILVSSDPAAVVRAMRLSKHSYSKMVQNLWWAAGYNIGAIPLAAGALYGAGIVLTPALGAVLMSLSTIVVAANAQLLRRK